MDKRVLLSVAGVLFFLILALIFAGNQISFPDTYATALFDRRGNLLSAVIANDGQWRFAPPDSLPSKYVQSVLVAEDRRFFAHHGVDPLAIGRAAWLNLKHGRIVSGASTITMQVIRLSRRNRPRTIPEKITELFLASALELTASKDEILRLYAAHAPFGGNVVGLEAAAWRYFGRPPGQLSWAESAALAVLPNAPALIHPGRNRRELREKRDELLFKMHRNGIIDSLTCIMAANEDLPDEPYPLPQKAPHLLEFVRQTRNENGRFITTIDERVQDMVSGVLSYNRRRLAANLIYDAAVLVIDNRRGEVIAYAGNIIDERIRNEGRFVDIIRSPRSTGSILKPILYASMVEKGELLPTQLIMDIPLRLGGFAPQNYSRSYNGAVPAAQALARSLNVPAVRMLRTFGVPRFYYRLKLLGMSTLFRPADQYGLSLILGGAEGTLWEITRIYAGFARSLYEYHYGYRSSGDAGIAVIRGSAGENARSYLFNPGAAWLTLTAMLEVSRPETEQFWQNFSSTRPIAWKTGTSFGHRDAWAVGVTPEYTVGVWAGNADGAGRPDLTGLSTAAPVLFDIYYQLPPTTWFEMPEMAIQRIPVCASSGYRPGPFCQTVAETFAPYGIEAGTTCPFCRPIHLDPTRTWRVNWSCGQFDEQPVMNWFVLPPVAESYYMKKHPEYQPLPPLQPGCTDEEELPFSLIHPVPGSTILVPVELGGEQGKTVLKAAHRRRDAILYWHLDDRFIGRTTETHELAVSPAPGEHRLTLFDDRGMMLQQDVQIVSSAPKN